MNAGLLEHCDDLVRDQADQRVSLVAPACEQEHLPVWGKRTEIAESQRSVAATNIVR